MVDLQICSTFSGVRDTSDYSSPAETCRFARAFLRICNPVVAGVQDSACRFARITINELIRNAVLNEFLLTVRGAPSPLPGNRCPEKQSARSKTPKKILRIHLEETTSRNHFRRWLALRAWNGSGLPANRSHRRVQDRSTGVSVRSAGRSARGKLAVAVYGNVSTRPDREGLIFFSPIFFLVGRGEGPEFLVNHYP
jgi:hypothetical protein